MQKKRILLQVKNIWKNLRLPWRTISNTADAISAVFELVKFINVNSSEQNSKEYLQALYQRLETLCDVLGIIIEKKEEILDSDIEAS